MKALLLAAGEGTRLRPLTIDRPKAMVEIGGRPAIGYALDWLRRSGVTDVAINLFHRPEVLQAYVGDGSKFGLHVRYSIETRLLGTAGALGPLREYFQGEELFVVLYGDVLTDLDLGPVLAAHRAVEADATVVVDRVADPTQSGMVVFDAANRITAFVEKPARDRVPSEWGNAGVYVCGPAVLEHALGQAPRDFALDVFPAMLKDGSRLAAWPSDATVLEFGAADRLQQAAAAVAQGRLRPVRGA